MDNWVYIETPWTVNRTKNFGPSDGGFSVAFYWNGFRGGFRECASHFHIGRLNEKECDIYGGIPYNWHFRLPYVYLFKRTVDALKNFLGIF